MKKAKKEINNSSQNKKKCIIEEKISPITEILKRIIASGFVLNAKPLSALLVAPVGAGKTTSLIKFSQNKNIIGLSDVTPFGLVKLLPEIKQNGVKHLVIYDLIEPMSRSRSCVNNLIGFLNSLMEEGIFKISTAFIEIKEPINLGLITCTTDSELKDKRRGWLGIGFVSRMIPISYDYTKEDVSLILKDLANQNVGSVSYETLSLEEKEIKGDSKVFNEMMEYSKLMTNEVEKPFRRLRQLKVLLMANALLRGDNKVKMQDVEWFKSIFKYLNYDLNKL